MAYRIKVFTFVFYSTVYSCVYSFVTRESFCGEVCAQGNSTEISHSVCTVYSVYIECVLCTVCILSVYCVQCVHWVCTVLLSFSVYNYTTVFFLSPTGQKTLLFGSFCCWKFTKRIAISERVSYVAVNQLRMITISQLTAFS